MNRKKRKKVLVVYYNLEVGGIEKKLVRLIKSFSKKKLDIELALFEQKGKLLKQLPKEVKIYNLKQGGRFRNFFKIIWQLVNIINNQKIEIIFTYGDLPGAICLLAKWLSKEKPRVIIGIGNVMSIWIKHTRLSIIRRWMNLFFLPQADKLIAVSKRIRLDLIENFMVPKRKVMVIYNLKDKLDLVKKRKKTRNKIPVILYAGRLVKQKRVDLLIKAFAEVSKLIKARLLIIGEGPEKDRLKNLIKKLEMQGKIKMENFTLDLNKRLADVDLVVLSSIVEGCPNIIMESMTVGTLVLATKYPGAEELIKDGQTGFLVDLEVNPKQLANA